MIPLSKNSIAINTSNSLNQIFNILPGNSFCNDSSVAFEKELLHAFENSKTYTGSQQIEKYTPHNQNYHSKPYRTSDYRHSTRLHRKRRHEFPAKSEETLETSSRSEESSESGSKGKHHVYDNQKTLIDALNSALLLLGYSPEEAIKIINAFQQGNFSSLNNLLGNPGNQSMKCLWQGEMGSQDGNSLTTLDPQLQNLLSSLMTASPDTDIAGKLEDTLKQLTTVLSKLHVAKGISGQNDSTDMLTRILTSGISAKSQELMPDISSSLAYWIGSGLENGENSMMPGLQQMVQNFLVTGTTKQHDAVDLNEIVTKFNLTPLTNQTFGFANPPVEEVPLLMNSSFIDQLAARLTSMATMGKDQLTFAIQPPQLGSLKVLIRVNQGNVQSLIQASSEEVKQLLNSKTHDLRQMLEQQGLNLTDFKVSLVQTASNTGETWNFTWNDNKENRHSSNPKEERNFHRNKRNDKNFNEQLDIIT